MKRTPNHDQLPVEPDVEADVEVWEPDEHDRVGPSRSRGYRSRLTASVPGAVAGVILVCALAFAATLGATGSSGIDSADLPAGDTLDGKTAGDAPLAYGLDYGDDEAPDGEYPGDLGKPANDDSPDGETPDKEPTPVPEARAIDLDLALGDGGRVRLEWGACDVDGFAAWKLVRSTDAGASFPLGKQDTLIAALEKQTANASSIPRPLTKGRPTARRPCRSSRPCRSRARSTSTSPSPSATGAASVSQGAPARSMTVRPGSSCARPTRA